MKTEILTKTSSKVIEKPPVVAVLGHVDHGKTSLLDAIRQTKFAEKEHGGITQKIGAYQVEFKGKKITFIDTPGHEAFTKMRARGAQITDIALLVVAADDGVMPQTKESIAHIQAAQVPMIVAVNKIDLPGADLNKVKQQLAENNVLVEEYGGDVVTVPVSAKTKKGLDELLDMINLVAEMGEFKSDLAKPLEGVVIESGMDRFKGPLASILIKEGVLKVGDLVCAGESCGKIKSMLSDKGVLIKEAFPSTPVQILGLRSVPKVGEVVKKTDTIVEKAPEKKQTLVRDFSQLLKDETKQVRLILKADVEGSLETLVAAIEKLALDKGSTIKFILKETGDINESDILLASASRALIIGFAVRITSGAQKLSEEEGVLVRTYQIIYELLDELKDGFEGKLEEKKEKIIGKGKVLAVFSSGEAKIAGCKIEEGSLSLVNNVKFIRGERELGRSKVKSLRIGKENVNKVKAGEECGVLVDSRIDFVSGDIIEIY